MPILKTKMQFQQFSKINLHELYPCNTRQELHRREGEVIREIGTLNKCIAGRTYQERYREYKDKVKEAYACIEREKLK